MNSFLEFFGRKQSPEEMVKKWRQQIRSQERELDKQIRGIDTQENLVKRSMKQAAKKNDIQSCKVLAKEVARSRKVKDRLYTSKAQLNSMVLQLQHQLGMVQVTRATLKVAGNLQKSTEIMKLVNNLIKLPDIQKSMMEMSQEMMKAGIIDEMLQETIEMADHDEIEEEAEGEVEKILFELTDGLLGQAGSVGAPLEKEQDQVESRLKALKAI